MKSYTIALAGNPNCGKTTLFNALTGSNQKIGNWPGVTVDYVAGSTEYRNTKLDIIDLPGTYSFTAHSDDERAARDYILYGNADIVVNIVDASNLEQSLFLTSQLIEMKIPLVVALNRMDIARKKKIDINLELLQKKLGCTVVPVSAVNTKEVTQFTDSVFSVLDKTNIPNAKIKYPNEIEKYIQRWKKKLQPIAASCNTTEKWCAIKLLEDDPLIVDKTISSNTIPLQEIHEARDHIEDIHREEVDIIIADYRYGFVHGLVLAVVTRVANRHEVTDRIDRLVLHRLLGVPVFLFIMYLTFLVAINIGSAFISFFDILFGGIFVDGVGHLLTHIGTPDLLVTIFAGGIGTGLQTVATFVPIIFFMFFMLAILEDSGYMARAAFVMDRFMRVLGLPGKAFVPMIVGFGCTVPAVMGTRILESRRDKFLTIFLTPFMSCGARLPVYVLFSAAFFPQYTGLIVFSLYMTGIGIALLTGVLLKNTLFKGQSSHFIMELPSYNLPRLKHIMLHTWLNLKEFIQRAGVLIIIAVTVLSVLNTTAFDGTIGNERNGRSILALSGKAVTPVLNPMGVSDENWPATVALITGIFAKESIIGTLHSLYVQSGESEDGGTTFSLTGVIKNAFSSLWEELAGLSAFITDPLGITSAAGEVSAAQEDTQGTSLFNKLRFHFSHDYARAYAYLLFVLIYFPCIGALGAIFKEAGKLIGSMVILYSTLLAWIVSTLFYQITSVRSPASIMTALLLLAGMYLVFFGLSKLPLFRNISEESRV